jgi:membrane protease YdiL (CAAX protease family)
MADPERVGQEPEHLLPKLPWKRPLSGLLLLGWAAVFFLVFAFSDALLLAVRTNADRDGGVTDAMLYLAASLVTIFAIAVFHAPDASLRELLGARVVPLHVALIAVVMGVCAYVPLNAIDELLTRTLDPRLLEEVAKMLTVLPKSHRILGVFARALFIPVADELLFRGVFASGVEERNKRVRALALITGTYAIVQLGVYGDHHLLYFFVPLGLLVGHARLATGSVIAALACQFGYRLTDIVATWRSAGSFDPLASSTSGPTRLPTLVASVGIVLLCAVGLEYFGRSVRSPPPLREE